MICWYCHWGWPKKVRDIYDKAVAALGDERFLTYGPAHIVWEDENFTNRDIEWCVSHFVDNVGDDWTYEQKKVVMQSLFELSAIPENERCVEPDDYDGEHPENFPPPKGLLMVSGTGIVYAC